MIILPTKNEKEIPLKRKMNPRIEISFDHAWLKIQFLLSGMLMDFSFKFFYISSSFTLAISQFNLQKQNVTGKPRQFKFKSIDQVYLPATLSLGKTKLQYGNVDVILFCIFQSLSNFL